MIYPKNFETKIGFDKIRNLLKSHCLSDLGKEKVDNISFNTIYELVKERIIETSEFKDICLFEDDFPTSYYIDARSYFEKIKIEGRYLTEIELFDIKRSLDSIKSIINFFKNTEEGKYPLLKSRTYEVVFFPHIIDRISSIIDKFGEIKNDASKELKNIRISILQKQSSVSKHLNNVLRNAQKEGWADSETTLTIRDGKILIPITSSYKRKIKGLVYDESATGKTSYIEPIEIIETNNQIRELEFAEKREIIKILTDFSNYIRPYIDDILLSYNYMAEIDFIRAKALFSIRIDAVKPIISNKAHIKYYNAKHPLLYLTNKNENKEIIPLNIFLNNKSRIVLISGPNAGGKSVCLKTVGLLQYMFQCGMLVPVKETSEFGIFENLFIDIGDEQSIENDLSTYSSHLLNMKYFIENVNEKTIILIDEFGTGTEPMLGASISESIFEEINRKKTFGVITTHYTNLKHYATSAEGIINGAMLFDSNKMQPLYELKIGKPGSSFAFEIAQKIGLPKQILESASNKIGQEHIDFDKHLKAIEKDRKYLSEQKKRLKQKEDKLDSITEKYNNQLKTALNEKKQIARKTKEDAEKILSTINKKIENTIHEIRKVQADKEKTKEIRKKLNSFKENTIKEQKNKEEKINKKIEQIKQRKLRKNINKLKADNQNTSKEQNIIFIEKEIEIGDFVRIKNTNTIGEVMQIVNNNITIGLGSMQTSIKKERLEFVSNNAAKKSKKTTVNIHIENKPSKGDFVFGLDLRGNRAEEALHKVAKYIDDAHLAEVSTIRILHGTGSGILRQVIRDYLKTLDSVLSVKDETIERGGSGYSIVEFR